MRNAAEEGDSGEGEGGQGVEDSGRGGWGDRDGATRAMPIKSVAIRVLDSRGRLVWFCLRWEYQEGNVGSGGEAVAVDEGCSRSCGWPMRAPPTRRAMEARARMRARRRSWGMERRRRMAGQRRVELLLDGEGPEGTCGGDVEEAGEVGHEEGGEEDVEAGVGDGGQGRRGGRWRRGGGCGGRASSRSRGSKRGGCGASRRSEVMRKPERTKKRVNAVGSGDGEGAEG